MAQLLVLGVIVVERVAGQCTWDDVKGAQGNSLSLNSLSTQTMQVTTTDNYDYVYSPCRNSIKCEDVEYMVLEGQNGFCIDSSGELADWDGGAIAPTYDRKNKWFQFHYDNAPSGRNVYLNFQCVNYTQS